MIINSNDYKIYEGSHSIVFANIIDNFAIKLFKSFHFPNVDDGKKYNGDEIIFSKLKKWTFQSELNAYKILQSNELLKKFTPNFFGEILIEKVICDNCDISNQFLLDCAYKLEYVHGKNSKLLELVGNFEYFNTLQKKYEFDIEKINANFISLGIEYLKDSQAIFNQNRFVIVDFGVADPYDFEIQMLNI